MQEEQKVKVQVINEQKPVDSSQQIQQTPLSSTEEILQQHAAILASMGLGHATSNLAIDARGINQIILLCNINNFAMLAQIAASNARILKLLEEICTNLKSETSTNPATQAFTASV